MAKFALFVFIFVIILVFVFFFVGDEKFIEIKGWIDGLVFVVKNDSSL